MAMEIHSDAFAHEQTIPRRHTADGPDLSPPLAFSAPSEGTKELALIMDDPDAPRGTWVHWVLYGLPPDTPGLPEGVAPTATLSDPPGAVQGINSAGKTGYRGPAPPPGKPHRYFFRLYALDAALDLAPGLTVQQLLKAMEGHVLARGELMGRYARRER